MMLVSTSWFMLLSILTKFSMSTTFYKKVLIAICVTKQKIVNKTPIAKDVSKSLLATYDNTKTTNANRMIVLNIVYS
ncbi:hypothetical protein JLBYU28_75 [Escherichia phage JLBYU28]|uniref:Uncharacterized protein n=1 Tax=Escherichia phage JLBYU28 TaxID=2894744 RepID=A0AAE8YWN3_9CAUD|nr:hypothetical protein JLBYU28_75 [Escherichia phage JLBYU28]